MAEPGDNSRRLLQAFNTVMLVLALVMLAGAALVMMFIMPMLAEIREDMDSEPRGLAGTILSITPPQWAVAAGVVALVLLVKHFVLKPGALTYLLNLAGMVIAVGMVLAYVVAFYGSIFQMVSSLTG